MPKIPYIPFYIDDYEAATNFMTAEQDGIYFRLIRLCWRTVGCSVPNDHKWLMQRLRLSEDQFKDIALPIINEFFNKKKGRVYQKRLSEEYEKIHETIKARSEAGKRGGRPKSLKNNKTDERGALTKRKQNESNHTHTHNHIKSNKKESFSLKGNLPEGFTEFRHKYPAKKNTDWSNGLECFVKWMNKGITLKQMLFSIQFWDWSDDDVFKPHPKALLNKELWKNMGDQPKPLKKVNGIPWESHLTHFKDQGIWYVPDMGPYPTTNKKPDGPINPDCKAPVKLIKEVLNRGDLI